MRCNPLSQYIIEGTIRISRLLLRMCRMYVASIPVDFH